MLTKIKKTMFLAWSGFWIVMLMCLTIFSPFTASIMFVDWIFILFMTWLSYCFIFPEVDWDDWSDTISAECVIGFFGGVFCTIIVELLLNSGVTHWEVARKVSLVSMIFCLGAGMFFYLIGTWTNLRIKGKILIIALILLAAAATLLNM